MKQNSTKNVSAFDCGVLASTIEGAIDWEETPIPPGIKEASSDFQFWQMLRDYFLELSRIRVDKPLAALDAKRGGE